MNAMKHLVIASLVLLALSCGKSEEIRSAPLTAPWTSWHLPELDKASVMNSSATRVTLFFKVCEKPASMFGIYDGWMETQGWKRSGDARAAQLNSDVYLRGDQRVLVGANSLPRGGCQVSLELQ